MKTETVISKPRWNRIVLFVIIVAKCLAGDAGYENLLLGLLSLLAVMIPKYNQNIRWIKPPIPSNSQET
jgi:hypothetical protein